MRLLWTKLYEGLLAPPSIEVPVPSARDKTLLATVRTQLYGEELRRQRDGLPEMDEFDVIRLAMWVSDSNGYVFAVLVNEMLEESRR